MTYLGNIGCSEDFAKPLVECDDCVYINTNITKVEEAEQIEFRCDSTRYTKAEYNDLRLANMELAIAELAGGTK